MLPMSIAARRPPIRWTAPSRRLPIRRLSAVLGHMFVLMLLGLVLSVPAAANLKQGGAAFKAGRFEEAFKHFMVEARRGTAVAQYLVASMYQEGQGTLKSTTLAASWYKLAADQGDAEAQYELALLLLGGEDIEPNPARAVELLEAASSELPSAMNVLGTLYLDGTGVSADPTRAHALFEQAAKAGDTSARYNLGRLLLRGQGTAPDSQAAQHWLRMAALDGHPGAQLQLGTAHAESRFGNADIALAAAWLTLASEQGMQLAKSNLETLSKHLKPAEKSQVDKELERIRARMRSRAAASPQPNEPTKAPEPPKTQ